MASAASLRLASSRSGWLVQRAPRRVRDRRGPFSAHRPRDRRARDDPLLVAAGMAAHQHLAVVRVADREARRAVVMGRAASHPTVRPPPPRAFAITSARIAGLPSGKRAYCVGVQVLSLEVLDS